MELLLDVWEGSLDISEDIIAEGGVVGLLIRLNHISGGHHMDIYFKTQWVQAAQFLRCLYFVYNPWVDGRANFLWLMANLPPNDVTLIAADIEVKYPDYSPEEYADQVATFTDLVKAQCHMVIYTGEWFMSCLSHWPRNVEYWWARYPYKLYPTPSEAWSYEKLRVMTEAVGWHPDPIKKSPGPVKLWQCSGDRIKLPGCCGRAVDVNLWQGDLNSLKVWWGADTPIVVPPTYEQKVDILWNAHADLHP